MYGPGEGKQWWDMFDAVVAAVEADKEKGAPAKESKSGDEEPEICRPVSPLEATTVAAKTGKLNFPGPKRNLILEKAKSGDSERSSCSGGVAAWTPLGKGTKEEDKFWREDD